MNGITYFRLTSPYDGDITKNCALTGNEVDNNFYTLEGRDVKSVKLEDGKIVVNLMNGDTLTTDKITEDCTKDLSIDFDEVNGILTITRNGVTKEITGFLTTNNVNNSVAVDGSVIGNGLMDKPLGLSPMVKTGQYRPVKRIIDKTNNEKLPDCSNLAVGDRFLTVEYLNEFGFLYNYQGLKKIACRLNEMKSQWRIPTKEDWDDLLDSIEPREEFRTHTDARSNKFLGKFAGKFLKSQKYWKKDECGCNCNQDTNQDSNCIHETDDINNANNAPQCNCGRNIPCLPTYCGEYGHCHHRHTHNNEGIGKYGFNVLPAGYANEAEDYLYFKERAYFWTATNHEYRDAYIKAFAFNKSTVLQDVMASDNYMSVRLVKNYNGHNYKESEEILGDTYSTVLMPSLKHGKTIWTSLNLAMVDCECECGCGCHYIRPNNGEGIIETKRYFTNEWTGKHWLRKELLDGESVVVIDDRNEDDYSEYRLVNGELKNVATLIYEKVVENFSPFIDDLSGEIEQLNEKIDNEIERSTTKDEEIQNNVDELNQKLDEEKTAREEKDTELENSINNFTTNLQEEIEQRVAEDARLQEEIDGINTDIENFDSQLLTQDGSVFDTSNGILTLKSKGGTNDINVQFNLNFGTF